MVTLTTWKNGITADADLLKRIYAEGVDLTERAALFQSCFACFEHNFPTLTHEPTIFVVRSPGRVNLRGMHIDSHGGYINGMCIQMNTIAVVHSRRNVDQESGGRWRVVNGENTDDHVDICIGDEVTYSGG
jgi:galactokinase